MLYSKDSMSYIRKGYVPHFNEYSVWRSRLSPEDLAKIKKALNAKVGQGEIHVSSWIPGNDWRGTVYQPLYEATGLNEEMAAMLFGLVLWETLMERDDVWGFTKWEPSNQPDKPRGMIYFKFDQPPPSKGSRR